MRVEELVGSRIREARERAGMSQPQLGEWLSPLLGKPLPRQAIHAAEQGRRQFTAAELVAFAHVLGCAIEDLFLLPLGVESLEMPSGKVLTRKELDQAARLLSIGNVREALKSLAESAQLFKAHGLEVEKTAQLLHNEIDRIVTDSEEV